MSWITDNLPGIASVIGGGAASLLGAPEFGVPIMGAGLGMMGQQSANNTNRQIASDAGNQNEANAIQQEQYQTQMSNTAYQRQAADMKAAGINPIMAGVQGGASTPSGASGNTPTSHMENVIGAGLNSGKAVADTINSVRMADSNVALNEAMAKKATADALTSGASARQMTRQTDALESQMGSIKAKAGYDTQHYKYGSDWIKFDELNQRLQAASNTANSGMSLLKTFIPSGWKNLTDHGNSSPMNRQPQSEPADDGAF